MSESIEEDPMKWKTWLNPYLGSDRKLIIHNYNKSKKNTEQLFIQTQNEQQQELFLWQNQLLWLIGTLWNANVRTERGNKNGG